MNTPRIMIAAPKSGSGKTLITCALLKALQLRGRKISAYKCGPDYIDPMFHKNVIGVPSANLDCFFSDEEQIKELFLRYKKDGDLSVIEGVMGLYDGLGGVKEEASAYHLAVILRTPIILVVDAKGMGRSILPLVDGFLRYDREKLIRGIILNRVGKGAYETLKSLLEAELEIPVLGFFPEKKELQLESRHLGLKVPEEVSGLEGQVLEAARILEECVDVEAVLEIARMAAELENPVGRASSVNTFLRLGVAMDEAFCFYYDENLRLLRENGAQIVPFSPIHDKELPKNLHGVLLGGGYPELWARQLYENVSMRNSIKAAIAGGMPSLAECGGFMYLHDNMETPDGETYPMCGIIPGNCSYMGKTVRFGYVEITGETESFLPRGKTIKAHEFHYYDSTNNGRDCVAEKPIGGKRWECIHAGENHWWGFAHLYFPSGPDFVNRFMKQLHKYKNCHFDKNMS